MASISRAFLAFLLGASAALAAVPEDPCGNLPAARDNDELAICRDGRSCGVETRSRVLCELRDRMRHQYSLYFQKEKRLPKVGAKPFRSTDHWNSCIKAEKAIAASDAIAFADRVRQCLAGFQDSHLTLQPTFPMPEVFTGFDVSEIGGKWLITGRIPKVIQLLRDDHRLKNVDEELALGNEVLSIDGRKPSEWRAELAKYISASTPEFAASLADEAIFQRNFAYPKKSLVRVTVKTAKGERTVDVPWFTHRSNRRDATQLLRDRGIEKLDVVQLVYNAEKSAWEPADWLDGWEGYALARAILDPTDAGKLTEYFVTGSTTLAYRFGSGIAKKARAFGYLQINSFDTTTVQASARSAAVPFLDPLVDFVAECQRKDLPIIVDLRKNPGGQTRHAPALASLFVRPNKKLTSVGYSLRTTKHTEQLIQAFDVVTGAKGDGKYRDNKSTELFLDPSPLLVEAFDDAVRAKKAHMDIIFSRMIEPHEKIGGFEERLVVLVTPHCVSTCDLAAALLKNVGDSVLVGTASNGTGAGFSEAGGVHSRWNDPSGTFMVRIPNTLFGVPSKETEDVRVAFEKGEDVVLSENRPTKATIAFVPTVEDVQRKRNGWLEAALNALFPTMP